MNAGGRTHTAGGILELGERDTLAELDVQAAARDGIRSFRFTDPQRLSGDDPRTSVAVVKILREAGALGLPVSWQGHVADDVDTGLLVHLAPPRPIDGDARAADGDARAADVDDWQRRHRPGLCHFRIGPGFVTVKDTRRPGTSARFRLEGVVDHFLALEAVVDVRTADPSTRELADDLYDEDLVFRLGDFATLLPNRIVAWPVPALEI